MYKHFIKGIQSYVKKFSTNWDIRTSSSSLLRFNWGLVLETVPRLAERGQSPNIIACAMNVLHSLPLPFFSVLSRSLSRCELKIQSIQYKRCCSRDHRANWTLDYYAPKNRFLLGRQEYDIN